MAQDLTPTEGHDLTNDLKSALGELEIALEGAGRSVGVIRSKIDQVATLADIVREMEAAMALARTLGVQPAVRPPEPPAQLRPVAPPPEAPFAPEPEIAPKPEIEPERDDAGFFQLPEQNAPRPPEPATTPGPAPAHPVSHRLRLAVASRTGPLDLKAVDGSVSENPAVVDVALLDYDGRQATLKLWIDAAADPIGVRDSLFESLRRRLGDERDAEIRIDFEERNAA